ncbi:MAG TPA: DUF4157 domain-containing protein [Bryobacteraceae bacterium]|nr:DUF4157 domain-containing protein [Bryobacteraceae bacterium]
MRAGRRTTRSAGHGSAVRGLARAAAKVRRQTSLAGNAAMAELLAGTRIHSDAGASHEADALGAAAFTRGGEIFLGSTAPPLDSIGGVDLLRHELLHVVQQARAHGQVGTPINQAGDAFEVAADNGSSAPAGPPPAIQRQFADRKMAHFPEKVTVLKKFFDDLKARGRGNLAAGLDATAKAQLRALAQAPDPEFKGKGTDPKAATRITALELLLNGSHSNDPATLAAQVAKILPVSMDPAVLKRLRPLEVEAKPKGIAKLPGAIARTTPNKDTKLPGATNQEKRDETGRQHDIGETQFPMAPVGQVPDVIGDLGRPDAPKAAPPQPEEPKPAPEPEQPVAAPPAPAPESPARPDVVTGASPIAATAPAHPGLGVLPGYASAAIQQAQEQRKTTADLVLGESLKGQEETVAGQVQHLLQVHARDAAGRVTAVNVYFGGKLARTVRLGAK